MKHLKDESKQSTTVDHKSSSEKIVKAIVKHNYPFNFLEQQKIIDIHIFLNSCVKILSRITIRVDICKLYNHKRRIKDELVSILNRICLAFDLWSLITIDGYMCVTAYYIDTI